MQSLFIYAIYGIYAVPWGLERHVPSCCSGMENFMRRYKSFPACNYKHTRHSNSVKFQAKYYIWFLFTSITFPAFQDSIVISQTLFTETDVIRIQSPASQISTKSIFIKQLSHAFFFNFRKSVNKNASSSAVVIFILECWQDFWSSDLITCSWKHAHPLVFVPLLSEY